MRRLAGVLLLGCVSATAQSPSPAKPLPGAPTDRCEFTSIDASTPVRITSGQGSIPYQFACGHNRPAGECVAGTLPVGLIVNVGAEKDGWSCVTGGDSTSGWIPSHRLAPLPTTPSVPLDAWVGWWRPERVGKAGKQLRLLITRAPGSNLLHISGRAYWYGLGENVHFGSVNADAAPVGLYLHAVEDSDMATPCVLDLKFDPAAHRVTAYDNAQCGGMNVRFLGVWRRFTPSHRR